MPESVTVDKDRDLIVVRSFESVSLDELGASIAEVRRLGEQAGIGDVLVDARQTTALPGTIDMFSLAKSFPREMRIAVLVSDVSELSSDMRFGETVARNRGIKIRLFDSEDEALEWFRRE